MLNACGTKEISESEKIAQRLQQELGDSSLSEFKNIYILGDGGCLPCNRQYLEVISTVSNMDSSLIVLNNPMGYLDTRSFKENGHNIIQTDVDMFEDIGIFSGCYYGVKLDNDEYEFTLIIAPTVNEICDTIKSLHLTSKS